MDKPKPHDLRDDAFRPRTSINKLDVTLAGDAPPAVTPPENHLVHPGPGDVPTGQNTKG